MPLRASPGHALPPPHHPAHSAADHHTAPTQLFQDGPSASANAAGTQSHGRPFDPGLARASVPANRAGADARQQSVSGVPQAAAQGSAAAGNDTRASTGALAAAPQAYAAVRDAVNGALPPPTRHGPAAPHLGAPAATATSAYTGGGSSSGNLQEARHFGTCMSPEQGLHTLFRRFQPYTLSSGCYCHMARRIRKPQPAHAGTDQTQCRKPAPTQTLTVPDAKPIVNLKPRTH